MTMQEFIRENRKELCRAIEQACPNIGCGYFCDDDVEDWILNDEGLYNWARSEGVEI